MFKFASSLVLFAVAQAGKNDRPVYLTIAPPIFDQAWGGNAFSIPPGPLGGGWGPEPFFAAPPRPNPSLDWGRNPYFPPPPPYNQWGGHDDYFQRPWDNTEGEQEDRSGWYNQWQQYSPPEIPYRPAFTKKTTYAECLIRGEMDQTNLLLEFSQFSG